MSDYILAIDQGTTSTRCVLYNQIAQPIAIEQKPLVQSYPNPGWVEHDPMQIWQDVHECYQKLMKLGGYQQNSIIAIGLTNQRETTVIWERKTGKPIYPAIVWQDRRTQKMCDQLKQEGMEQRVHQKTGLVLDPYFSASKIRWLLDNVMGARARAEKGKLAFGTIDTFLLWHLTGGKVHLTDMTNASRTLLFNLETQAWDPDLLKWFGIPASLLPEIRPNVSDFGNTDPKFFGKSIPITGMAGDQQAALIGQACVEPGQIKSTFGTGCFVIANTGAKPTFSKQQLLTTFGYRIKHHTNFALEGSIFMAGAIIEWLTKQLGLLNHPAESAKLAYSVDSTQGAYLIPAFTGLGAPYWKPEARAALIGLTRGHNKAHIVRAGLEAVVYQTKDLIDVMNNDMPVPIQQMRVDGGMIGNLWMLQFLSDLLQFPIYPAVQQETTALGAAFLAGIGVDCFNFPDDLIRLSQFHTEFTPKLPENETNLLHQGWLQALNKVL